MRDPQLSDDDSADASLGRHRTIRAAAICLALFVGFLAFSMLGPGSRLSLAQFAAQESAIRKFHTDHPALAYIGAFVAYLTVTGLSLPGATAMTLIVGWLFGFWRGMLLVSVSSTAGATIAFLLSRHLFRDAVERRFGHRLQAFNKALAREGAFYLFMLRLIPVVPFFVINAVMGLTPLKGRTFWWVSQLGMLPGTAVYVFAGTSVPRLQTLTDKGINAIFSPEQMTRILTAFVLIGILPLIVRLLVTRFYRPVVGESQDSPTDSASS
jgi:uncharacterized membrane protein YdjX (TVP38/TMEM64 family)